MNSYHYHKYELDISWYESDWFVIMFWQILKCISQLEMAQLIGTGVKARYITGGQQAPTLHHAESFDPQSKINIQPSLVSLTPPPPYIPPP